LVGDGVVAGGAAWTAAATSRELASNHGTTRITAPGKSARDIGKQQKNSEAASLTAHGLVPVCATPKQA